MGVFHTQPSEIDKMEWERLVWMHEGAIQHYRMDLDARSKSLAVSLWGTTER